MANYRNPNGYGSIVKLSGKRRNPYVVRKTVGYDDRAFPIYQVLGYFPTRKDAVYALAEYNHDPFDIELSKITFEGLYQMWYAERSPKMQDSLKSAYNTAYNHCKSLYKVQYRSIRKFQMQEIIDGCGKGYSTRSNIKMLFSQLDRYAYDQDIITKGYAANLDVGKKEISQKHVPFTDEEVQLLWKHRGEPCIDEALFLLYTGCRLTEMLQMRCDKIDLEQNIMIGGIKTVNGINRTIPIHPELLPIIKDHLSENEYLFNHTRPSRSNDPELAVRMRFAKQWKEAMQSLGMNHLTHDCRHTVRSKLDSAGANKVAIDKIMGHSSSTIGEKVYTHKTVEELQEAMNLLSYGAVRF